jgi:hypothetical protein
MNEMPNIALLCRLSETGTAWCFWLMPRLYFHTHDGCAFRDEDGTDLPNAKAASIAASKILSDLLWSSPNEPWKGGMLTVTVTDAEGLGGDVS